jgi:hypothetical protein
MILFYYLSYNCLNFFPAKIPRHHSSDHRPTLPPQGTVFIEEADPPPPSCTLPEAPPTTADDIASVVRAGSASLTDDIRHSLLTKCFLPPHNWKGPSRQIGKKIRRAPAFIFDRERYSSLSYSPQEDSVYCADCVAFSSVKVILVSKPLTD